MLVHGIWRVWVYYPEKENWNSISHCSISITNFYVILLKYQCNINATTIDSMDAHIKLNTQHLFNKIHVINRVVYSNNIPAGVKEQFSSENTQLNYWYTITNRHIWIHSKYFYSMQLNSDK